MAFDRSGTYVATAGSSIWARVFNRNTGEEVHRTAHTAHATSVAFSPDGQYLAVGFHNNQIDPVWKVQRSTENVTALLVKKTPEGIIPEFEEWAGLIHGSVTRDLAFSSNGLYLATRGDDTTVRIWEVATIFPILNDRFVVDRNHRLAGDDDEGIGDRGVVPMGKGGGVVLL